MTSSAEEEVFFSNFARRSSITRKKSSDVNAHASALMQAEFSADGSMDGADGEGPSGRFSVLLTINSH
jgi:hypothetical protein